MLILGFFLLVVSIMFEIRRFLTVLPSFFSIFRKYALWTIVFFINVFYVLVISQNICITDDILLLSDNDKYLIFVKYIHSIISWYWEYERRLVDNLRHVELNYLLQERQMRNEEVMCFAPDLSTYQWQWGLNLYIHDFKACAFSTLLHAGMSLAMESIPGCIKMWVESLCWLAWGTTVGD